MRIWTQLKKLLNKSEEKKPTTVAGRLELVVSKLAEVDAKAWYLHYRPINGMCELKLYHTDPEILIVRLSTLNVVLSEGGYVDNVFNAFSLKEYSFDEWFTIRGEFVNFPVFIEYLRAELITLQKVFSDMEVCKVDKLQYYIKKSRMLIDDLENVVDAIAGIGKGL